MANVFEQNDAELPDPQDDDPGDTGRAPAQDRKRFYCPRCGAFAHQNWARLSRASSPNFNDSQAIDTVWPGSSAREWIGAWFAAQCSSCMESSIWRDDQMVFPRTSSVPLPHQEMPDDAKALYNEARDVVGLSRRAGAALARASLERLLRTLDPEADTLPKVDLMIRIDRILDRISGPLGEMLTVIRHVGNKSLHVEDNADDLVVLALDPEDEEIVEMIFESINDLVDELIIRPARTRSIYDRVPQGVRDAVEARRAAPRVAP